MTEDRFQQAFLKFCKFIISFNVQLVRPYLIIVNVTRVSTVLECLRCYRRNPTECAVFCCLKSKQLTKTEFLDFCTNAIGDTAGEQECSFILN